MARGGTRQGAGRPQGAANKFSEAAREIAASEGITPLEYMLAILRDTNLPREHRMDAAKAAAPYMHSRLESVKHSGDEDNPVALKIESDAKFREACSLLDAVTDTATGSDSGAGEVGETIPPSPKDA